MSSNAFQPNGDTVAIAAATGASTGVRADAYQNLSATQRLVQNIGSKTAYLAASLDPLIEAEIPADGTPGNGVPIQAGAILVLTYPPGSYFSAIAAEATTITITPGEGN